MDIDKLDIEYDFIDLSYDFSFKYVVYRNIDLFKKFLIRYLEMDIDDLVLVDNKYCILFMKDVDTGIILDNNRNSLKYVVDRCIIDNWEGIKKLFYVSFNFSNSFSGKNIINGDISISIDYITSYNVKYLDDIFCNSFVSGIMSCSYRDLYNNMRDILSKEELDSLIHSIVDMSKDRCILRELSLERIRELLDERSYFIN